MIYSIGHSNYHINVFLDKLTMFNINAVVDVRSNPYSKLLPYFNIDYLKNFLKQHNCYYIYMGDTLGARQTQPKFLSSDGKVDFCKVAKDIDFNRSIDRLIDGHNKNYNIALMCSESDPLICHRFSLISRALKDRGYIVQHILKNGNLIAQQELENNLIRKFQSKIDFLLQTNGTPLEQAYFFQNKEIGFNTLQP